MGGVNVAQLSRPTVGNGDILVAARYSMVSPGTELAALRSPVKGRNFREQLALLTTYGGLALKHPDKAIRRIDQMIRQRLRSVAGVRNTSGQISGHGDKNASGWALGYSSVGRVIEVGEGVEDIAPGQMVACAGAGIANHAEFILTKRRLVCPVPEGCSLRSASSATIAAIALQGVRRADLALGEHVAVVGLGLLGQITTQLLQASGCAVSAYDPVQARVGSLMKEQGTISAFADLDKFESHIKDVTGGLGVDAVIVTASAASNSPGVTAMKICRRKGKVIIVGDFKLEFPRADFYQKEIDLLMSTSYGPGRYDEAYEKSGIDYPYSYVRWTMNRNMSAVMALISKGKLDIESLIDKECGIDEAHALYDSLLSGTDAVPPVACLIEYGEPESNSGQSSVLEYKRPAPRVEGKINFALVGAGAFGLSTLVPTMARCNAAYSLRGIVSADPRRGADAARTAGAEFLSSDLNEVLGQNRIDLAVLATRHNLHAKQAAMCLRAGVHVFVEKPLAISWEQLNDLKVAYAERTVNAELMVGFNRRFSPAVRKLGDALAGRRGPIMVNYRVNAGAIPLDHWTQGAEGGGRNLGEACHMYDVFRFLAAAPAIEVSAQGVFPETGVRKRNDNFTAMITYADGSVGVLTYTSLGPKDGLGKERVEVFCDGDVYIIDDFKSLVRGSDMQVLWQASAADKGHLAEFQAMADSLVTSGAMPIPVEELFETTAVSLNVEDVLRGVQTDAADPALD